MATIKGVDIVVKVNTGTEALPVFSMVGGQRGATLNRSSETMESTHKGSNGWKEFDYSFKEWSVESDGLIIETDAGYAALEDAFMTNKSVKIEMSMPNGDVFSGQSLISDLPIEAPYDDFATYSVTFQGSGALVKTEA